MDTPHATSQADPLFTLALAISFVGHIIVLGAQLLFGGWIRLPASLIPVKLVYEQQTAHDENRWMEEELHRAQSRLKELPPPSSLSLQGGGAQSQPIGRGMGSDLVSEISNSVSQIRIGEGGALSLPSATAGSGAWSSAIDLTNVIAAAQGNPVLLSYFSAIREQIQRTANGHPWLPQGAPTEGVICIGFVLNRTGEVQSATIITERSAPSSLLRDVALRIIKSSGPFPPFPPSFTESSKTIMVPIEFVLGS